MKKRIRRGVRRPPVSNSKNDGNKKELKNENEANEAQRGNPQRSQAEALVAIGREADLFRGPHNEPFATVDIEERPATLSVRSSGFAEWLLRRNYMLHRPPPTPGAVTEAQRNLAALAVYEGPHRDVFVRIGQHEDRTYVDLGNPSREVVVIDNGTWAIERSSDVRFIRGAGTEALPQPESGGDLAQLRSFLNVGADDAAWRLLVAWECAAYRARGPYALLALEGEQGSTKSTCARMLRALIDPNSAPLRSRPRNERDLMIAAMNSWVVTIDNVSRFKEDESDMLCRLATGNALGTRELFTNQSEIIFNASRPIIVTSIGSVVSRSDLADRSVMVRLPPIDDRERKDEATLWADFSEQAPKMLGALLDVVADAHRRVRDVRLSALPRMADFARFGVAVEQALRWPEGSFLAAYQGNRLEASRAVVEGDPVAQGIVAMLRDADAWKGTMSKLLEGLRVHVANWELQRNFPVDPGRLGSHLMRIAPALRASGIVFERAPRTSRQRPVEIRKEAPTRVTSVTTVTEQRSNDGDDSDDGSAPPGWKVRLKPGARSRK